MFDQSTLQLSENGGSVSLNILPEAGVISELTSTIINYQVTPSLTGIDILNDNIIIVQ